MFEQQWCNVCVWKITIKNTKWAQNEAFQVFQCFYSSVNIVVAIATSVSVWLLFKTKPKGIFMGYFIIYYFVTLPNWIYLTTHKKSKQTEMRISLLWASPLIHPYQMFIMWCLGTNHTQSRKDSMILWEWAFNWGSPESAVSLGWTAARVAVIHSPAKQFPGCLWNEESPGCRGEQEGWRRGWYRSSSSPANVLRLFHSAWGFQLFAVCWVSFRDKGGISSYSREAVAAPTESFTVPLSSTKSDTV